MTGIIQGIHTFIGQSRRFMKKSAILSGLLSVLFLLVSHTLLSQRTAIHDDPDQTYRLGIELFNKEKYANAQKMFRQVMEETRKNTKININAEYYRAICAYELFNENAEYLLNEFIKNNPSSAKIERAYFQLGRYHFREKDYRDALEAFNHVELSSLSANERIEYNFKTGFGHLQNGNTDKARMLFASIKDIPNKYASAASYYYGHIAYENNDYGVAKEEFAELEDDKTFGQIIPYYLIHIYYHEENYELIIEKGPQLLEQATSKRKAEIARLIGDAYYRLGDYETALEYLEIYLASSRYGMNREDNYQVAYTYYMNDLYEQAIQYFQNVINEKDSLSQNAYYHLADCYLETGQKEYASNAFLSAYKLDYNEDIKENALFNYAQLSLEVARDPYNESIKSLEKYINEYPNSDRIEEAYNLLVQLFLSTHNYKAALESIEKIKSRSTELEKAYQKITFYRALELYNNGLYYDAIDLFKRATKYDYDEKLTAKANYWIGESFYRLGKYWGALKYFNEFVRSPHATGISFYSRVYYNLGYTYFKRDDFSDAANYFKKFIDTDRQNINLQNDALLRLGDCYFINKRYTTAIDYYDKALQLGQADIDYGLFQKGMAQGALGEFKEKIETLNRLVKHHRGSPYVDNALFELGLTEQNLDDSRNALVYFDKLTRQYPQSNLARKAMLKIGLIYYNNNQYEQAIRALKEVAEKYPNTHESRDALASLKVIYIDLNKVDDYFEYTKGIPDARITTTEQDSLMYMAAENQYMLNDCEDALPAFRKYLNQYPNGAFALNAHYYKADCELRRDSVIAALQDYKYVIEQPASTFHENAFLNAARLSYQLGLYQEAYTYYKGLEEKAQNNTNLNYALEGQMKSSFNINNYTEAIEAAQNLLHNKKLSTAQSMEAHFILGKSYYEQGNLEEAKAEFIITSNLADNQTGAEAKYYQAEIQYKQKHYQKAEEAVYELIDNYSSYDYWLAKSYILLADVYVGMDNIFQARQTLQSIIENYKGPELSEVARQKLQQINTVEKEKEKKQQADTTENEIRIEESKEF